MEKIEKFEYINIFTGYPCCLYGNGEGEISPSKNLF